jgi:DNA-binding MarR family transcriptional regulator
VTGPTWGDFSPVEQRAWHGFLRTHADLLRRLDADLRERCGVSFGDYDVLVTLRGAPDEGMRMGELAKAIVLSPSGVTRVVARLEAGGLVERVAANQRIVRARLTDEGRETLRRAAPIHLAGVRAAFVDPVGDGAQALADAWDRIGRTP